MQIIQFKENQKEIWNKFIAENSSESFLQAWEWGEFQKDVGKKILRIGVISNSSERNSKEVSSDKLLAVALLIKYDLPFGQNYLYCPRGPIISQKFNKSKVYKAKSQKSKVVDFLFSKIEKIGKKEKTMFLKIDPPISFFTEENTKENKEILKNFKKSPNEIQPRNTLILDLTKSEEELLKEMKSKTRYNMRLAKRKGVEIINTKYQIPNTKYFNEFWKLVQETSRRDKFASHNKNYYWEMLKNCCSREQKFSFSTLTAKLYFAEYENKTIAANIVLFFGDLCIYLHGASSNKHRNVMAPYLLQWNQILDAKKAGCKFYDFWGIENSQKSVKSKVRKVKNDWSGITRFKKGFGGQEKNYVGAYDLIFQRWKYELYKFFRKIKRVRLF